MTGQIAFRLILLTLCSPVLMAAELYSEDVLAWNTVVEVPVILQNHLNDEFPDETIWASAGSIDKFYSIPDARQVESDARILVLFDGQNLFFNAEMQDANAGDALQKCYLSNEPDLRRTSNISIYLEPEHNHGKYYRFIVDSKGNRQDLCVDDESWQTNWFVRVEDKADGNVKLLIKIPLEGLGKKITDGDVWGFNVVLNGVAGTQTISAAPVEYKMADASGFGHLLFNEKLTPERVLEIKHSLPRMHQDQYREMISSSKLMCGPELKDIEGELRQAAPGKKWILKNGRNVTCIGLDNDEVVHSAYPFIYEKYENQKLHYLRKLYRLEEIVSAGKNDFEKMLLLNEWLVNHVPFGSPPPIRPDAMHVLENGLTGQTFNCTYLSFTLMQMYMALGYTARKITSVGHGTLDVWSDYWGKWIQIDPSRNSYYRMRYTGVPLNSNEIRREHWKNGGIDMEMVYGTEQRAERVTLEKREKDGLLQYRTDGYQWVAYKSRNNFFEIPFAYWNFDYLILEDEFNRDQIWTTGNKTDTREILGTRTSRVEDVFWTLNQACIHLYDKEDAGLLVQLETVTPNFKTFEYSVDEGEWKKTDSVFQWKLHEGQNTLRARSVNKFGISGKEHKIVLKMEPYN